MSLISSQMSKTISERHILNCKIEWKSSFDAEKIDNITRFKTVLSQRTGNVLLCFSSIA